MIKKIFLVGIALLSPTVLAVENGQNIEWSEMTDLVKNDCSGTIIGKKFVLTAAHCSHTGKAVHFQDGTSRSVVYNDHPSFVELNGMNYDVSVWTLDTPYEATHIRYLADINQQTINDKAVLSYHGFGSGELQRAQKQVDESIDRSPASTLVYLKDIGQGNTESGDSGGAWLNDSGDIVGVLRGGHGTVSTAANLYYSKDFLLESINGWHYPGLATSANGKTTITVQSIHKNPVTNAAYSSGDVQITGGSCLSMSVINAFEKCTYDVESQGGEGKLYLSDSEYITINKVKPTNKPDPDNGSSGSSGGSLGLLGILLLGIGAAMRKRN
ncbi:putative trypsin protease [Vibrio nigripulchritudo FTn2]|uniref:trypsin-like serine peptidase n=1 Tax=Vibrio nigripulchritudo TaxID=28173 RepID=UPI0003B1F7B4|nr:trypsin-like serine protease [Vibrio nigripulchritudo]CCN39739.1 putative trypsin protease [Vibrio nigripulchritudo FTn2]